MSLQKKSASVVARRMAEQLRRRTALTITEGFDASGNPTLAMSDGTPASAEQYALVRIVELDNITLNSVGSAAPSYRPHVVQVALEALPAATTPSLPGIVANSYLTIANMAVLMAEVVRPGARVEVYSVASGTLPVVADMVAGNLKATIDPDLMFGVFAGT
jgi:hypothetical protein